MVDHHMNMEGVHITWLGHATFKITSPEGKVVLIDPWLQGNPACPDDQKQIDHVDIMLISHGHFDHAGDAVTIAKATNSTCVGIVELTSWLDANGVQNTIGMNKGGTVEVQGIKITMTHALHSSSIGDSAYAGEPCGFVLEFENGRKLYHAGDTCAFSDMQLINELYRPDVALLPIGDFYTMGPREAAVAVRMLGVKHVIPMHYGTFPILTGTPAALQNALQSLDLGEVEVIAMTPGQTI